ncbi:MAG: toluene tolerance protein, partial [Gammaproteobacteria bacterium]|nr:toluene tolerance protein [Gammaproteobacteria bacterium]
MKEMSREQYESLRKDAEIKAADQHGDKVLLLADGTYLKLFRIKRLITSARLFPYWRRFELNAQKLDRLGIRTLQVRDVYNLSYLRRTAVNYEPLPGKSLRDLSGLDADLVDQLGEFMSGLHDKGVYLRSLHLGNVVLTPEGELGLIDIADMKIHGGSLSRRLRLRNYHHLCRYDQDRQVVAKHSERFLSHVDEITRPKLARMLAG